MDKPSTYVGYLALAIGLISFLGGISNRLHHSRLPTAEQCLGIGGRLMTGATIVMLILSGGIAQFMFYS